MLLATGEELQICAVRICPFCCWGAINWLPLRICLCLPSVGSRKSSWTVWKRHLLKYKHFYHKERSSGKCWQRIFCSLLFLFVLAGRAKLSCLLVMLQAEQAGGNYKTPFVVVIANLHRGRSWATGKFYWCCSALTKSRIFLCIFNFS